MRTETPQEAFSLIGAGRKNLLINGDMRIAQRATSTNSAASNTYIVDRWQYEESTTGVVNVEQSSDAPDGFKYSSKITITTPDTSIASTDFQQILYKMEANDISHLNYGTSSAKTCTLSFWVKSSKTGIFPFSFQNHIGTRVYPENYTVNQANTWEYKTIVFPGDTGGSWVTTGTSVGLRFTFQFMLGSNYTGGTRGAWAATTGYQNLCPPYTANLQETNATLQITGVQLEVGKNATEFEHRSYGEELALCQRYYEKSFPDNVTPAKGSTTTSLASGGQPTTTLDWNASFTAGTLATYHRFKVDKRGIATMTFYGTSNDKCIFFDFGTKALIYPGFVIDSITRAGFRSYSNAVGLTNNSSWGVDLFNWVADAEL